MHGTNCTQNWFLGSDFGLWGFIPGTNCIPKVVSCICFAPPKLRVGAKSACDADPRERVSTFNGLQRPTLHQLMP
eukprot:847586-Rhodomonas_salina.2